MTLAVWPLCYYVDDSAAGQGVGHIWWAVTPPGAEAAATGAAPVAEPASSSARGY